MKRAVEKDKCTKDSDSNTSVVNRDALEDTAIGVGERATRSRSIGLTNSTQRTIHRKTRCKQTSSNGQTQRRKGKVTTSANLKVQVKARARENIQEKGTTTRTGLDFRMKKLDSAS